MKAAMRLAIPLFGPRVSPRFDHAPRLLLLSLERGKVVSREEIPLGPLTPWQRVEKLKDLKVEVVICGGIDEASKGWLIDHRIQVIPLIAGEANRIVIDLIAGRLKAFGMIAADVPRNSFRKKPIGGSKHAKH
jgi:predicted Fe-Mo cluster-binding NifX family protein